MKASFESKLTGLTSPESCAVCQQMHCDVFARTLSHFLRVTFVKIGPD